MILLSNYPCLPILQKTVEDISERNESLECPVIDIVDNNDCQYAVETCSSQTQTEPCNSAVSTADKGTQVEELPMRPYHVYESRKRSEIKTEIINQIRRRCVPLCAAEDVCFIDASKHFVDRSL